MFSIEKYATATTIYFSMVKRGVVDLAQTADWTPATGDTKISINGGTLANTTNNPAIVAGTNGVKWSLALTSGEMTGATIDIQIVDSATKAVEDQSIQILTYGNASAKYVTDFSVAAMGAVMPTTAGRTLDIASTGEAGLDFANVNFPAGAIPSLGIVDNGTAQSATGTTLVLRSAAAFADSELIGATVIITGGTTGVGQSRIITANVGSTDTVTVDTWTTTPTGTITYVVYGGSPASTTLVPNVNVAQISGDSTAADNLETMLDGTGGQTLSLGALTISGATTLTGNVSAAAGVTITQSTTNGHGISVTGNGTGAGINAVGGATGNGVKAVGGSTSGDAIITSATSGHGITAAGGGTTKHGINAVGGATTSAGIAATGGSTSGDGVLISATSGHGINTAGGGTTKHGINAAGGATTSHGINAVGGGTGNGAQFTSGSGATGQGINITSAATNGSALVCTAAGSGTGFSATGGASGKGALFAAGATGTAGLSITGGGTSGAGMTVTTTSGDAIQVIATAGHGMSLTANGTSKHGMLITGGTAGTSDGLKCVAGTGGLDIRGDITKNAMVESYAADGAAPTIAQALLLTQQAVMEFGVSGTTLTVKKVDKSTTTATVTLSDATSPTSRTRAS